MVRIHTRLDCFYKPPHAIFGTSYHRRTVGTKRHPLVPQPRFAVSVLDGADAFTHRFEELLGRRAQDLDERKELALEGVVVLDVNLEDVDGHLRSVPHVRALVNRKAHERGEHELCEKLTEEHI